MRVETLITERTVSLSPLKVLALLAVESVPVVAQQLLLLLLRLHPETGWADKVGGLTAFGTGSE